MINEIKFLDGIACPRCKTQITYSVELLQRPEKLICPSCLAEFYPNYSVKQRLKDIVVSSPESEEIKIDAVDNLSLDDINSLSDISIE